MFAIRSPISWRIGSDVGLQELTDLLQALAKPAFPIIGAIFRLIFSGIGFTKHVDGFKGFRAGAAQHVIDGLRVHGFKAAFSDVIHAGVLRDNFELLHVRQRDGRGGAAQHAGKIGTHGHGAKRRSIF